MTLPPRLHLSRHGIYYFRAIVPRPVRTLLRLKGRELRISLRTTDLRRAKTLLAEKNYIMSKHWEVQPWEIEAEHRQALYEKGFKLIKKFGAINLNNEYELTNLSDELGSEDLKAYIFAQEYLDSLDAKAPLPPSAPSPSHGSHVAPAPKPTPLEDATFEKALQRFEKAKLLKAIPATVAKYVSHCRLFIKIISNENPTLKLSEMQTSHIRHYRDTIPALPRKVDPRDSRPITELLQSAGPQMAAKTLFSHVQSVGMFLGWCKDQQYMVKPAFDAILKDLRKKPKPKKIRRRFTNDELEIIFEPNRYCQFKRDSDYWVPLIGLFTGARAAEICQLLIQDVIFAEGRCARFKCCHGRLQGFKDAPLSALPPPKASRSTRRALEDWHRPFPAPVSPPMRPLRQKSRPVLAAVSGHPGVR